MARVESLSEWIRLHRYKIFDLIRIYLGIGLFIKGVQFLLDLDFLAQLVMDAGPLHQWAVFFLIHYVALCHIGGGACLALGLMTRAAAACQIPILFGATFLVHTPEGAITHTEQFEFAALVLFLLCLFAIFGAGRLSLDYQVWGVKEVTDEHDARVAAGLEDPSPSERHAG